MAASKEKYDGRSSWGMHGKWIRKQYARWMRRLAKRDPENAPRKNRYEGWYT